MCDMSFALSISVPTKHGRSVKYGQSLLNSIIKRNLKKCQVIYIIPDKRGCKGQKYSVLIQQRSLHSLCVHVCVQPYFNVCVCGCM